MTLILLWAGDSDSTQHSARFVMMTVPGAAPVCDSDGIWDPTQLWAGDSDSTQNLAQPCYVMVIAPDTLYSPGVR